MADDAPPPTPAHDLAASIGSAVAAAGADRDALLDVCYQVVRGGDYARARLGHLVANAVISALQESSARVAQAPGEYP